MFTLPFMAVNVCIDKSSGHWGGIVTMGRGGLGFGVFGFGREVFVQVWFGRFKC